LKKLPDLSNHIHSVAGLLSENMHPEAELNVFWITERHVQKLSTYTRSGPKSIPLQPQNGDQAQFKFDREIVNKARSEVPSPKQGFLPNRYIVLSNWNAGLTGAEDPFEISEEVDFLLINLRPLESGERNALGELVSLASSHKGGVLMIGCNEAQPDDKMVRSALTRALQNTLFE
jgi:hypothetical protein